MAIPSKPVCSWRMSTQKSYLQTMENDTEKLLISALEKNLSMSIEERIDSHENARQLVEDLANSKKE